MPSHAADYDDILQANLKHVFGERDASLRAAAIRDLYSPDAVLYEPDSIKAGYDAISQAVEELLASLPPAFVFSPTGPAVGHHGVARLRWRAGPPDGPVAITGTDVARIEAGRIASLHVFIDPPDA
ncbi:MAG: nuclear transport factor 2 family protein [Afipia sp.]|nr:nuclear transport factor 2 family protein [Afipia sp.]